MRIKALPLNIIMIFIFLSLTMGLSAATIRDKTGDFGDTDVISVQVDIVGQSAVFTSPGGSFWRERPHRSTDFH